MELAAILSFLSDKTPEFVIGSVIGLLIGLFAAYVYLMPRLIKAATAALTAQVELLTKQITIQTGHIEHLEEQIKTMEKELAPYKAFAKDHIAKLIATKSD